MGRRGKRNPEEQAEFDKRTREFRELLEKRRVRDAELRAERERRAAGGEPS